MKKTSKTGQHDWVMPLLAFTVVLALAAGFGFLLGQKVNFPNENMPLVCQYLSQEDKMADCIALRSAVATEAATSVSQRALWVSFGSLVASIGALVGLIAAVIQGQRTITLATDANRITMENGQAQARAYIVVQSVECRLDKKGVLTVRVKFQNSGLSPARRLRWLCNASLDIISSVQDRRTYVLGDEPDLEKSHWRQDIPSAESWTSPPLSLRRPQDPEISTLADHAAFIAVTVKVVADYQDVFGLTHQEIACFQGRSKTASSDAPYIELERAHDGTFDDQAKLFAS